MNINVNCTLCETSEKNLDHVFIYCDLASSVRNTIASYCPNPSHSNVVLIDWLKYIWINKHWYNKIYGNILEKIFTIWSLNSCYLPKS